MEVGEKIKFDFGKGQKEGIVFKLFEKTVYIKTDFDNHKEKVVKRKISRLTGEKKKKKEKKQVS